MSEANASGAQDTGAGGGEQKPAGAEDLLSGEGKPGETKNDGQPAGKDEPKGDEGKGKTDDGKAEDVEYKFEFPEGVKVNEEELTEFKAVAKELKLDAQGAQKLAALRVKYAEQQAAAHTKMADDWGASAKTDKEFGGDKFEENLGVAKKALDAFGTPELKEFLKATRLGNHPELIRAFYRAGKTISEDTFVKPGATTGASKSTADTIYGTT